MKQYFLYVLLAVFTIGCSSDDGNGDTSSSEFTGSFSARLDGGIQNGIPVTVNISESSGDFTIRISGNDIDPDIVLTAIQITDILSIDACTDMCYQGDGNITNSGLVEIDNGKRRIFFGVYFPEDGNDESDAIFIEVEEN